ncbi:MAG: hypothetical protein ACW964_02520 [Candidatus Hodarchaeales archaeon]
MQWMKKLSKSLDQYVGVVVRKKVMKGSEELKSSSSGKKKARWVEETMERIDELVEEDVRKKVLISCSHVFPKTRIKPLKSKYKETDSIDAVLKLMHQDTSWRGLSYYEYPKREGNIIYVTKIPCNPHKYDQAVDVNEKKFHYCHCGLVKASLKTSDIKISPTFCYCGVGWYKTLWEGILDKSVRIEILQSVIQGDNCCEFAVHLPLSEE